MSSAGLSAKERLRDVSKNRTELLRLLLERKSVARSQITPRTRVGRIGVERLPLSWAQQRMWFIDQLERGSAGYQVPLAVRLRGSLDRAAVQSALDEIVRRHESLRTTFVSVHGLPMQQIAPEGRFELQVVDLTCLAPDEREAQVERHKADEVNGIFDLSAGPLVRGRLLCLQEQEHVLLVTMHHIASDGWSRGVLVRELIELYGAFSEGRPHALDPLSVQYADYARWQQEWLQGEAFEKQLSYWLTNLQGAAPQIELPTDRPRSMIQSYRGANVPILLDAKLSADLKLLARSNGATLFMVLYAGWAILLSRLSGQEDVVIGTPIANRQRPEVENLIGLFVNPLALRVAVRGGMSLSKFIAQVREVTLGAYNHQDVPFEKVVEAVQPERNSGRSPLFQVIFGLQAEPTDTLSLPGLQATREEQVDEPSIVDLWLSMQARHEEISGAVNYATDLFDRGTIERWMACYAEVLSAMTSGADTLIGDLPILPASERRRVVALFNDTQVAESTERLIHELFEEQVARSPGAIAVVFENYAVTYQELNSRANQLAWHLREKGAGPDRLVGVCFERGLPMIVALLGVLKSGAAYIPLDPSYPTQRLGYMLDDASPRILLTQESLLERVPVSSAEVIALDRDWSEIARQPSRNPQPFASELTPSRLAYVIYTSGSTGNPKGVMVEHGGVVNFLATMQQAPGICPTDCLLAVTTVCFDIAGLEIFLPLISGAKLLLASREAACDAGLLMELVRQWRVTILQATPATWQLLLNAGWAGTPTLKALCGGEALTTDLSSKLVGRVESLWNLYGPTETTIWSCRQPIALADLSRPAELIGEPIANTQIYILDQRLQPVPIGVAGEIHIGGRGVARGYLGKPEITAQRFLPDPFTVGADTRMYRTGDQGRWLAEGSIEYLGRNDHQVKIRGYRIELGEIEVQLRSHTLLKDAVVIAREDTPGEKRLVAYVIPIEPMAGQEGSSAQVLRTDLQSVVPDYMVPSAFVFLERFPLTPNGKLDRLALPRPEPGASAGRAHEPVQGHIEEILASIWQGLLRAERIGRHDNFFELGGHSLYAMKMIAEVAEQLGVRLSVMAVFQNASIQQLAQQIATLQAASIEEAPVKPAQAGRLDQAPLAFSQLARWRTYQSGERHPMRQLASATRLHGPLDNAVLQKSLRDVVRRHDSLRTQIALVDGTPMQRIARVASCELALIDLTNLAETQRESELSRLVREIISAPVDIATDALFSAHLFKLQDREQVLLLATEHIISDLFSLDVLLHDLMLAYVQTAAGHQLQLPGVGVQFADYASRQRAHERAWLDEHQTYWAQRLAGRERLRFPAAHGAHGAAGWTSVPVLIGPELKARMQEWCRRRQTTIALGVFTAYVALVLHWCRAADAVIQFQSNGRGDRDVENTFGFFASSLYVSVELREEDSLSDLLPRVVRAYFDAHDHADHSLIAAQDPPPPFTRSPTFNWVPHGMEKREAQVPGADQLLTWSRVPLVDLMLQQLELDQEPGLMLYEHETEITGGVQFPANRFSAGEMQRFARKLLVFIEALIGDSRTRVKDIPLE